MSETYTEETEAQSLAWPSLTDRIFVEASAFRGGWVANRPDERLYRMIKGFQETGDLLLPKVRRTTVGH